MAVNYAIKYSDKVAERFAKSSVTAGAFNEDVKFDGANTVRVYSVDTAPLNNYSRSSTSRYGTPVELGDSVQSFTLANDKSFTYTIDKGNDNDQMNVKAAAKTLKREIDEVISPYLDKYRLGAWAHQAGQYASLGAMNTASVVESVTAATAALDNRLVPEEGRTLFVTADNYRLIRLNPDFVGCEKLGEKALGKGVVGELDGMRVVKCPEGWLPTGVEFLITHKSSVIAPTKLRDYKIHSDPPGINGNLVEGRIIHDAYVLASRADGVYAGLNSAYFTAAPTATNVTANHAVKLNTSTAGSTIYYTLDGTDPRFSPDKLTYSSEVSYNSWDDGTVLTAAAKGGQGYWSGLTTFTV